MKKIISTLIAVGIASVLLPCYVLAAESGKCGENVTWTLDDNGTLTISGTGAMPDYSLEYQYNPVTNRPWKYFTDSIKSVVIEDGITTIGNYAFIDCENLASVELSDTLTSIGKGAFGEATSLTNITIPDTVTYIGNFAFRNCDNLSSVVLPDAITEISHSTFTGCVSLKNIELPDSLKRIGDYAFEETLIESITIPDSVTYIGEYAFYCCNELTAISIPNSVETIGSDAFGHCYYLKDIILPDHLSADFDIFYETQYVRDRYVTENGLTYYRNTLVKADDILDGDCIVKYGTQVIANGAFNYCQNLTRVILPDTVTKIGYRAFVNCNKLKEVVMSDNITHLYDDSFKSCKSLKSIYIPASTEYVGKRIFNFCDSLTDIYYEGTKEKWEEITAIGKGLNNGYENAKIHYNSTPQENTYTAETALADLLPDGFTAEKTDNGCAFTFATDTKKAIAAHYNNGRLIDVDSITPTNGIVKFAVADDTDSVKIWSYEDNLKPVFYLDTELIGIVLANME